MKDGIKARDVGIFNKKFDALWNAPLKISFGYLFQTCSRVLAIQRLSIERAKLKKQITERERNIRIDEIVNSAISILWGIMTTWMGWKSKDAYVSILRAKLLSCVERDIKELFETMPNE